MNNDASPPLSAQIHDWSPLLDIEPHDPNPTTITEAAAETASGTATGTTAASTSASASAQRRHDQESRARSPSDSRRRRRRRSRKKRNPGLVKKLAFVTHLLKTLDLVVFAELSSLYYMECSMFRFALRALGQYMYLTPKDEAFPFLMPATRVHVFLIVVPNVICMLLHIFASLPRGPDFHRGYQHGGLVIDFIGQKPPTSRMYYLLADVIILVVQCVMLTVHTDRENLRAALKTFKPFLPEIIADAEPGRSAEDLDAEERGVSRHAPDVIIDDTNGIELQSLNGQDGEESTSARLLGESRHVSQEALGNGDESSRTYLSDLMSSGNAVIGEYHVLHSMRSAAMELERTAAHSLQTIGYRATLAALQAQRRNARPQNQPAPPNR